MLRYLQLGSRVIRAISDSADSTLESQATTFSPNQNQRNFKRGASGNGAGRITPPAASAHAERIGPIE